MTKQQFPNITIIGYENGNPVINLSKEEFDKVPLTTSILVGAQPKRMSYFINGYFGKIALGYEKGDPDRTLIKIRIHKDQELQTKGYTPWYLKLLKFGK